MHNFAAHNRDMTNEEFWLSIKRIIDDGFSDEGLSELEKYAESFIAGRLVYKRFSSAEQHGCNAGGTNHVIASILAGAEVGSDKLTAPRGSFEREKQCAKEQERRLRTWAARYGCWLGNTDDSIPRLLGKEIARGGEARVYDNGMMLIKVIGLDYFVQPVLALDRITLHNTYFPQTGMRVIGFGEDSGNDFVVVVEQPFIQGVRLNDEDIESYAEQLGYRLVDKNSWTYATDDIYLSDLHDENVLLSAGENVFVIDCDIRINVASLKAGGCRNLTNIVEFI